MLTIQNILIILFLMTVFTKYILQKIKRKTDKKYFMEVLNHNLRICILAQIHGFDLLMKEGAKTNLQEELFSALSTSCKHNLEMVTTLLETYKFENNELYFNPEVFDTNNIDLFYSDEILELIKEKSINITHNYKNYQLYTDKKMFQKLINNLVYISLAYSYKNTEIAITITPKGKSLQFNVTYRGSALSKHVCNKSIEQNADYMAVGCGIKMYYCKKIANYYREKITLSNIKNNKISLSFSLPILYNPQEFSQSVCQV